MVPFSKRLQEARNRKKLRQIDAAEHFEIAYRTYQNYEGGQRRPDYEMLVAFADFFDVTTDYLLGRTEEPG